jgi:hypothetical protein
MTTSAPSSSAHSSTSSSSTSSATTPATGLRLHLCRWGCQLHSRHPDPSLPVAGPPHPARRTLRPRHRRGVWGQHPLYYVGLHASTAAPTTCTPTATPIGGGLAAATTAVFFAAAGSELQMQSMARGPPNSIEHDCKFPWKSIVLCRMHMC